MDCSKSQPTLPDAQTSNATLLEAALAYAARGWHIFPCHTPTSTGCDCSKRQVCKDIGKHPWTQHGLNDASTDAATIRKWWTRYPKANIGIRTGAVSGLVVLDVDFLKGGTDSLAALEQSYQPLPETVLQLTGNGQHYLFKHPEQYVPNRVETLGPGIDIRGDGGYIIAAPSLHANGKRYTWEVLHEPDETPLAPIPAWLLALCREQPQQARVDAGAPIPDGQRNQALFTFGCRLRGQGCTEAVILAALLAMDATQSQPPKGQAYVQALAARICTTYPAGTLQTDAQQRRNGPGPGTEAPPLPLSDYTNALAFVRDHGQDLRYCEAWKKWLIWTGTHWRSKAQGPVFQRGKHTIKQLLLRVDQADDAQYRAWLAHIKRSLSTAAIKAMVESAQNEPGIAVGYEELNQAPWLLPCLNGTLDLTTGRLQPHARQDLLTECLDVPYDAAATCPRWKRFLWQIMGGSQDDDTPDMSVGQLEARRQADARAELLVTFLQRVFGMCLTGDVREQDLYVFYGTGANGKSTLLGVLLRILGQYGMKAAPELLMASKDHDRHPTERADLFGKRLVAAIETEQGRRLNETLVKELTGSDPVRARRMREDFWEFMPSHKIILATNHKPEIRGTDHAIWRRIKLIPFTVTIPDDEQDKELPAKLLEELPGILAWMVQGCLAWQQHGLGTPETVVDATSTYREEMDDLQRFLTEVCLLGKDHYKTSASTLLKTYHQWSGQTTETAKALAQKLHERGFESKRGNTGMFWLKIGLFSSTDSPV